MDGGESGGGNGNGNPNSQSCKSELMESDDDSEDRNGSAMVGTDGNPTAYKRKIA